ncbi:MAG: TadE/TadG family type IV pilus assembly protein [Pirellulales bacterium]
MELLFLLPIAVALFLAMIEFSFIWTAQHRVTAAARAGCRAATMPGNGPEQHADVQRAVAESLGSPHLVGAHRTRIHWGQHSGDMVAVQVSVPMRSAAPDMLAIVGFGLPDRDLIGQAVMRRE